MNQAIDHRQYVIYWYKSNNVDFKNIDIWHTCPYLGIRILAITEPFLGNLDEHFFWELRRLLSID